MILGYICANIVKYIFNNAAKTEAEVKKKELVDYLEQEILDTWEKDEEFEPLPWRVERINRECIERINLNNPFFNIVEYKSFLNNYCYPDISNIIIDFLFQKVNIFTDEIINKCARKRDYLYYDKHGTTLINFIITNNINTNRHKYWFVCACICQW